MVCGEGIEGACLETATGERNHPGCFCCIVSSRSLENREGIGANGIYRSVVRFSEMIISRLMVAHIVRVTHEDSCVHHRI
jgi:hypothetical protein